MKRPPRNIDGAFPLLHIGSALLVYCAILRNEALASSGAHFPLWGVVGAVGAVIAGAGVYSIFLDPSEPPESAPEGYVMVPKTEWEAARSARRATPRPVSAAVVPPWWEGPEVDTETPPMHPTQPPVHRPITRPAPVPPARARPTLPRVPPPSQRATGGSPRSASPPHTPTPRVTPLGPTPPTARETPLSELEAAISELEALVDRDPGPGSPRPAKASPQESGSCVDCGREMARDWDPSRCSGCGRTLCVDCALASQFEDTDLRCIECRAREPRPGRSSKAVARRR